MNEPEITCPIINSCLNEMQEVLNNLDEDWEDADYIKACVETAKEFLESIREANAELRTWGQHWLDRAESLNSELEEALSTIGELEDKVALLEKEIGFYQEAALE